MSGIRVEGNTSGNVAEVDNNNNLLVNMPTVITQAGYQKMVGESDAGLVTGAARLLQPEISEDYRARVELDTVLAYDAFNYVAQDTGKYIFRSTTMTGAWGSGAFSTNASGITTTSTGVQLLTRQYFPVINSAHTLGYFKVAFTGTWGVTNSVVDIGFMTGNTSTPYAPTDGVFFRCNNTGMFGVSNVNGVEATTSVFKVSSAGSTFSPTIGTFYDCIIELTESYAIFWIDLRDGNGFVVAGRLTNAIGAGRPVYAESFQFGIRHALTGAASAVMGVKLASWSVVHGGFNTARPWSEQMATAGMSGAQGQQGGTMGSTALYTNSLAPGAGAAMTNTTAALGTGLGGQFAAQPTLTANTDGILCSYLNPVPTTGITGRILVIDSIKIDAIVTTAFTGGPVAYAYSAAWGHDSLSLATGEAATTKASRRKALGFHNFVVTAAVGATGGSAIFLPTTDIVVNPGEYFQIVAKNMNTVTSAGVVCFHVSIQSHWAN